MLAAGLLGVLCCFLLFSFMLLRCSFLASVLYMVGSFFRIVRASFLSVCLVLLLSSCGMRGRDGLDVGRLCSRKANLVVLPPWLSNPHVIKASGRIDRGGLFAVGYAPSRSPGDSFQDFRQAMKNARSNFSTSLQQVVTVAADETVRESGIPALSKMYFSSAAKRSIATNALRALVLSKMRRSRFFYDCNSSVMYVRVGSYVDDLRPEIIENLERQSRRMGIHLSPAEIRRLSNLFLINLLDSSIQFALGASAPPVAE